MCRGGFHIRPNGLRIHKTGYISVKMNPISAPLLRGLPRGCGRRHADPLYLFSLQAATARVILPTGCG